MFVLVLFAPAFAATHQRVHWQARIDARLLLLFFPDEAVYREAEEREDEDEAEELEQEYDRSTRSLYMVRDSRH